MCPGITNLAHRNKVCLLEFRTVKSKIVTLSSVVSHLPVLSCNIVIGCIKLEDSSILVDPGRFTLDAPELPLIVLNYQIISLVSPVGCKDYITELFFACRAILEANGRMSEPYLCRKGEVCVRRIHWRR